MYDLEWGGGAPQRSSLALSAPPINYRPRLCGDRRLRLSDYQESARGPRNAKNTRTLRLRSEVLHRSPETVLIKGCKQSRIPHPPTQQNRRNSELAHVWMGENPKPGSGRSAPGLPRTESPEGVGAGVGKGHPTKPQSDSDRGTLTGCTRRRRRARRPHPGRRPPPPAGTPCSGSQAPRTRRASPACAGVAAGPWAAAGDGRAPETWCARPRTAARNGAPTCACPHLS